MIVFDLICSYNHQFEAWFQDLADLEKQLKAKLLNCPICGDDNIIKTPSTFAVGKSSGSAVSKAYKDINLTKEELTKRFVKGVEDLSKKIAKDYDDVGGDFANEALKMHYGASEKRKIRGVSTPKQEELLKKEGVDFLKVPFINKKPEDPSTSN